jgi:hypothetical protein
MCTNSNNWLCGLLIVWRRKRETALLIAQAGGEEHDYIFDLDFIDGEDKYSVGAYRCGQSSVLDVILKRL